MWQRSPRKSSLRSQASPSRSSGHRATTGSRGRPLRIAGLGWLSERRRPGDLSITHKSGVSTVHGMKEVPVILRERTQPTGSRLEPIGRGCCVTPSVRSATSAAARQTEQRPRGAAGVNGCDKYPGRRRRSGLVPVAARPVPRGGQRWWVQRGRRHEASFTEPSASGIRPLPYRWFAPARAEGRAFRAAGDSALDCSDPTVRRAPCRSQPSTELPFTTNCLCRGTETDGS